MDIYRLHELFFKGSVREQAKYNRSIVVLFENEPPLELTYRCQYVNPTEHESSVIVKGKNIFYPTKTYTFKYTQHELQLDFMLRCGSITESISEEKYNELLALYNTNLVAYNQQADMDEIEQRIKSLQPTT